MTKIMKKLIFTFCCAFTIGFAYSQQCGGGTGGGGTAGGTGSVLSGGTLAGFNMSGGQLASFHGLSNNFMGRYFASAQGYSQISGSPYLTNTNVEATLIMNDDVEITNVPMKIDLYANEIIVTNEEDEEIVLDTRFYKEIYFVNDGEQVVLKKVNPKKPEVFYEVLYESGDVVFFKEQRARLKKGENYGIAKTESKFNQHKSYYVKGEENAVAKVNLKKRDVFNHFPEIEAIAFKEYVKKSKIKLSKEKDYKELFAAMDD